MDSTPHKHELKMGKGSSSGHHYLDYGDQTMYFEEEHRSRFGRKYTVAMKREPTPEELRKLAVQIIRVHDQESIAAGERQAVLNEVKSDWYKEPEVETPEVEPEKKFRVVPDNSILPYVTTTTSVLPKGEDLAEYHKHAEVMRYSEMMSRMWSR
jgi:hypothetical protein